ncbi:TIGR02587 family membrane protein [Knoellia sp. S7-12]|uniref:TIGR02587 family membrane protein n=1 Tax=Knoellia sp. S7-12 TaxID=3126698 RepID=UPI003367ECB8
MARSPDMTPGSGAALQREEHPWRAEVVDLVRAASGGLLFGVPLLYTMEVWWAGTQTPPWVLLGLAALLFVPVFVMSKTEGFRATRDVRWRDAGYDTVEAVAVALAVTAAVLVLLRELTTDTPLGAGLGKVLYEALPFCLGIGVARHLLSGGRSSTEKPRGASATLADLGATTVGAVFVSLSIAPTDEVPMVASAMTPMWLLAMMAASLLTTYAIVFVAGFSRQDQRHGHEGPFQHPITETVVCYLIALATAFVLLWIFQHDLQPWPDLLARTVVLGFPAAIGGAAGRLAI